VSISLQRYAGSHVGAPLGAQYNRITYRTNVSFVRLKAHLQISLVLEFEPGISCHNENKKTSQAEWPLPELFCY
jgi:hypothetical protein